MLQPCSPSAPIATTPYDFRMLLDSWAIWHAEAIEELCHATDPARVEDLGRFTRHAAEVLADLGLTN